MWTCQKCGKPVYFAERKQSIGFDWHPWCLKCAECGKVLHPGKHAEHKATPYCHIPCYSALFGPKLFGHGSTVESHQSFGQRSPSFVREERDLERSVREYNAFLGDADKQRLEVKSREVNGRLVLEGVLRVYWGVDRSIRLKEFADKRVIVKATGRGKKAMSLGYQYEEQLRARFADSPPAAQSDDETMNQSQGLSKLAQASLKPSQSCSSSEDFQSLPPMALHDGEEAGSDSVQTNQVATESPEPRSRFSVQQVSDSEVFVRGAYRYKSLPSMGKEEKDEIDELLQVERTFDPADRVYHTIHPRVRKSTSQTSLCESINTTSLSSMNKSSGSREADLSCPLDTSMTLPAQLKDLVDSGSDTRLNRSEEVEDIPMAVANPPEEDQSKIASVSNLKPCITMPAQLSDLDKDTSSNAESHLGRSDEIEDLPGALLRSDEPRPRIHRTDEMEDIPRELDRPCANGEEVEMRHTEEGESAQVVSPAPAAPLAKGKGPRALRRRHGKKMDRAKLQRRSSVNGHWYDRDTSVFTPPKGSCMSVHVTSLLPTQEVIKMVLDKYQVESEPHQFALYVIKESGERRKVMEHEFPLRLRVTLGPHEDIAKLYLLDRGNTKEIKHEVAQYLRFSATEIRSFLNMFYEEEEREVARIQLKYEAMRRKIQQRMNQLQVRLK